MISKVEMVSVVIPTLNEAGNILETVTTIHNELAYPKEIIIVDGNSTDGTREIVKKTEFCRLIIEPRRGYGLALRTGMKNAKGDVVVMVDGDGTYEVKHINLFDFFYSQFLSDTQSGFRAICRSALEKVDLVEDDMAFATEMLVQFAKKDFKMVEVPSSYRPRKYGNPKMRRIKSGIEIFTTMAKGFLK